MQKRRGDNIPRRVFFLLTLTWRLEKCTLTAEEQEECMGIHLGEQYKFSYMTLRILETELGMVFGWEDRIRTFPDDPKQVYLASRLRGNLSSGERLELYRGGKLVDVAIATEPEHGDPHFLGFTQLFGTALIERLDAADFQPDDELRIYPPEAVTPSRIHQTWERQVWERLTSFSYSWREEELYAPE